MLKRLGKVYVFLLLFLVVFLLRLAYGYQTTPNEVTKYRARGRSLALEQDFGASKRNYASNRYLLKGATGGGTPVDTSFPEAAADQKYEKTATLVSATMRFDEDERVLRDTIDREGAIVQFEQGRGLARDKNRELRLVIGVQPQGFDTFCEAVEGIGEVESVEITKTDKTNEYRNLKAQRASLEATQNALVELKRMQGDVEEFVNLQYKILDVDRQLRELGVQLGDYDEVNEFCTVRFLLYEDYEKLRHPPTFLYRFVRAFAWTAKYACAVLFACAFFSVCVLCVVTAVGMVKKWSAIYQRYKKREEDEGRGGDGAQG